LTSDEWLARGLRFAKEAEGTDARSRLEQASVCFAKAKVDDLEMQIKTHLASTTLKEGLAKIGTGTLTAQEHCGD
jgi:hypothetical protein